MEKSALESIVNISIFASGSFIGCQLGYIMANYVPIYLKLSIE